MDTTGWTTPQKVDWTIVWAEMNGYDFNERVLRSWVRDPAFYKSVWMARSDVPAHEGPTHHRTTEVWTYDYPLSPNARERFLTDLRVIPALNTQARKNLTGNARELWIAGIRDIRQQTEDLKGILSLPGVGSDPEISEAVNNAIQSTESFVQWLEGQAPAKTGPSGIGRDNYTWYLQNVHLVPLTWADEVMLLKRELTRAWSALKLEEHRNRNLPPLSDADSPEAYNAMADKAAESLIDFLEEEDIVTVKPYFDPALREHLGEYIPKEKRNFFTIGEHYDPRPLYSHFYHWFELARMDTEPNPSPIRRGPLLYNIFDSRNEGTATAVEELFMQAGLYDDSPRSREIVYIMIAQRAARGLADVTDMADRGAHLSPNGQKLACTMLGVRIVARAPRRHVEPGLDVDENKRGKHRPQSGWRQVITRRSPVDERNRSVCVSMPSRRGLRPATSEPCVTPVAAKITSEVTISSRA
jgi:hypothetical protein